METVQKRIKKPKISGLATAISKKIGIAIADYDMLQEGDKVVVAVSGGKDSTTLLEMLKYRQTFAPIRYDLLAVHIDFGIWGKETKKLEDYLSAQGVPYHIEKIDLLKGKTWEDVGCFWCSWNRRKALFQVAGKYGFNKIALGHHMDDIIETILLNLFFNGTISAMKPKQELFDGKLTVIRPLAYVEEDEISRLAQKRALPFHSCHCPNSDISKRLMVKKLIAQLVKETPHVKKNIFKSVKRIKEDYLL